MSDDFKGHRGFAAFCDWATRREAKGLTAIREKAGAQVGGRILEVGVGVGTNWAHLPEGIEYTGIEPDPYILERARKNARERGETRDLQQARAEALPFEDASFDTVLSTWTLCTIEDPQAALKEFDRVLKPGGVYVFAEHVKPESKAGGLFFDAVTPCWRLLFGGCHPNRQTEASIRAAGFEVGELSRVRPDGLPNITGVARKPASAQSVPVR